MNHNLSKLMLGGIVLLLGFAALVRAENFFDLGIEKHVLANGMNVILKEDHRLPNVTVGMTFHAGSACEVPGKSGYAHLFEHMMFQGTEHVPGDFSGNLEVFGGDGGGATSRDFTWYFDMIPSNYLERTLWMEADRLANIRSSFSPERLDVQREVVLNERRQYLDNTPYSRFDEVLAAAAYPPNHPYSWEVIGSVEDLLHADSAGMVEFSREYYSPNNATLILVGDFVKDEALELAKKYFEPLPAGPPITRRKQWTPTILETKRVVFEDNVSLPRLCMQWPSPRDFEEDDAAGIILGRCLSTGVSSRLYKALIEERNLAVSVYGGQGSWELCGEFLINVQAQEQADLREVERVVDSVLTDVIEHGVTEGEVEGYKRKLLKDKFNQLQSGFAIIYHLCNYDGLLGDPDRFDWDMNRFMQVTAADVQRFAQKYLDLKRRTIVHCVPFGERAGTGELPDWTTPPEGSAEAKFTPPKVEQVEFENGLKLQLVERHDFPVVYTSVLVKSGWASDPPDGWGVATMVQALIDEGTTKHSLQDIGEICKEKGASIYTSVTADAITVSLDVLKESFDPMLDVVADMIMNSTFPENELVKKKAKFTNIVRNNQHDPEQVAMDIFNLQFFGSGSPFGQPEMGLGTEASIAAMTRDDLLEYYRQHFTPGNTTIVIAGDLSLDEATQVIQRSFGEWQSDAPLPAPVAAEATYGGRRIVLVDQPEATQSMICIGHRGIAVSDPDYQACRLLRSALQSYDDAGRINRMVREERGYSYGLGVDLDSRAQDGMFRISGTVETEHTAESLQLVLDAMNAIVSSTPVGSEELEKLRTTAIRSYPLSFESNSDVVDMLTRLIESGRTPEYLTDYVPQVLTLDENKLLDAGKRLLNPDAALIVIVGDRARIENSLKELNLGEVTVVEAGVF